MSKRLQHIVLFAWPEPLSAADEADMRSQVTSWPSQIPGINRLRLGKDLTGERTRGHSQLLYMEFDGVDEMKSYQAHPVHQVFHRWVIERHGVPLAFDYFLDDDTVFIPEGETTREEERQ
jgi:hypothetical protein